MKQQKQRICTILAICFVGVLLGELYLFKNYPDSIYIVAAGMAVLLILTYFLSSNLIALHNQWLEEKSAKQEELLNRLISELSTNRENHTQETSTNVEKFEKAIYVALQQHTAKMQESISQFDQAIAGDFDRLCNLLEAIQTSMTEQMKSMSEHSEKVYVKFSRENTKSLMMFQKKAFDNVMIGMEETVQETTKASEKTQAKLDELKQTLSHLNVQPQTPSDPMSTVMEDEMIPDISLENITSEEEEPVMPEEITPDISQEEIPAESAETIVEDIVVEDTPTIEEAPVIEETPVPDITPVNNDPNHVMTPEEIAALVAGTSEPAAEEIPTVDETPVAEPTPVSNDPNHVMTPEEIAALVAGSSEPAAEAIPIVDETPVAEPTPVSNDPNHVMTPEEIAALVAGSSEPAAEEIPTVDETPVAEPTPVSNDPNHVMTPEEIAALVAGSSDPIAEDIPFVDDTPVQTEPTPINDDPNHVMTPEEIAALIAGNQ